MSRRTHLCFSHFFPVNLKPSGCWQADVHVVAPFTLYCLQAAPSHHSGNPEQFDIIKKEAYSSIVCSKMNNKAVLKTKERLISRHGFLFASNRTNSVWIIKGLPAAPPSPSVSQWHHSTHDCKAVLWLASALSIPYIHPVKASCSRMSLKSWCRQPIAFYDSLCPYAASTPASSLSLRALVSCPRWGKKMIQ